MRIALVGSLALAASGCIRDGGSNAPTDRWVDRVALHSVGPPVAVPGSVIVLEGEGFLHPDQGINRVEVQGELDGQPVERTIDAHFVDDGQLELELNGPLLEELGVRSGRFRGGVRVSAHYEATDRVAHSEARPLRFELQESLTPRVDTIETEPSMYINSPIAVRGEGLLLGGKEGETRARVWGCYYPEGRDSCRSVEPVEVPLTPQHPFDRTAATFPFAPVIAGVEPGFFRGTVQIVNVHGPEAGSRRIEEEPTSIEIAVQRPRVRDVDTSGASLGQYVDISGHGFVGWLGDGVTMLEIEGTFRSAKSDAERPVNVLLVPELRSGRRARYVMSEEDPLGEAVDLRREHGRLEGTIRPVVRYGGQEVRGEPSPFQMDLLPLRQVVYLSFQPSYTESLRHFGLRGLDGAIRARILEVVRIMYQGINVDFRHDLPEDFAVYSHVDIAGPDPNGHGLFGYDNTPGKDTNNMRLHDRIGGVNATTQKDGYPGYGGIFLESLFGFSERPPSFTEPLDAATPAFDAVFDPLRPDRGGTPVQREEVERGLPKVTNPGQCPAAEEDRPMQIGCAVWVLGNLIASTLAHEVGHSLGLANPYEKEAFHYIGDARLRLMDAGGARPFDERTQLAGEGPERFCDEAYEYLHELMPAGEPQDLLPRPPCN